MQIRQIATKLRAFAQREFDDGTSDGARTELKESWKDPMVFLRVIGRENPSSVMPLRPKALCRLSVLNNRIRVRPDKRTKIKQERSTYDTREKRLSGWGFVL